MNVFLDLETRSRADIKSVGGNVYVRDSSTELLCGVAVVGGDVYLWSPFPAHSKWVVGDKAVKALGLDPSRFTWHPPILTDEWCPPFLSELAASGATFIAHNGEGFDRPALEAHGFPDAHWVDSMHRARQSGLPAGLDAIGGSLFGLGKDKTGQKVLKTAMSPMTKGKRAGQFLDPDVGRLSTIARYCARDVLLMLAAWEQEGWDAEHPDDDTRRQHIIMDRRGIPADLVLAQKLLDESERLKEVALLEVEALGVDRAVVTSPTQMVAWLAANGVSVPDAQKGTLQSALDSGIPEGPATLIRARLACNRVTLGKAKAALATTCPDGRMRGTLAYWGAHTGRWAGRGFQTQNLTAPVKGFTADAYGEDIPAVAASLDVEEEDVLASMLRGIIVPEDGRRLCMVDYEQIEARVLLWLAEDDEGLQVFRDGRDIYRVAAAGIYGMAYDDVEKGSLERTVGKVSTLACLSEGTMILTDRGWICIESVLDSDLLWDGLEWVPHGGVVYKGVRDCIEVGGVWLTPDHEVLTEKGWVTAGSLDSIPSLPQGIALGAGPSLGSSCLRTSGCGGSSAAVNVDVKTSCGSGTSEEGSAPNAGSVLEPPQRRPGQPSGPSTCQTPSSAECGKDGCPLPLAAARTQGTQVTTTMGVGVSECTQSGSVTGLLSPPTSCPSKVGTILNSNSTGLTTTRAIRLVTSEWQQDPSKLEIPVATREERTQSPANGAGRCSRSDTRALGSAPGRARAVLDIVHAGPRNRFQAGPLIVHNCGYQGGPASMQAMASNNGLNLEQEGIDAEEVVNAWRDSNAAIAGRRKGIWTTPEGKVVVTRYGGLWKEFQHAAKVAVLGGGEQVAGRCRFRMVGRHLHIVLPSGRPLVYREAQWIPWENAFGGVSPALTFMGVRFGSACREATYGGRLVENGCQAVARDVMAEAMVKLEAAGFPPLFTVHDEIISSVTGEEDLGNVTEIMCEAPKWAPDLPLRASGEVGDRYGK